MNDVDLDFGRGKLGKRLLNGLDRALNVGFYNNIYGIESAAVDLGEQFVERYLFVAADHLFTFSVLSFGGDRFTQFLFFDGENNVARVGYFFKTYHGNGDRRAGLFDHSALIVEHSPDFTRGSSRDDEIARFQSTVLNDNGRNGAFAFIELGFKDSAFCLSVRVGFKLLHLGNEQDGVEKFIHALARLCGNGYHNDIAAPIFDEDIALGKLLTHSVEICMRFIYLVRGDDYRNARRFRVVYGFDRLRHYTVVGGDDNNSDIGDLRAPLTHRGERGVARGIDKGYRLAVGNYRVRADMLRYAARFAFGNVRRTNVVEKRRFTVVDVPHNGNDGRTGNEVFVLVGGNVEAFGKDFFGGLFHFELESYPKPVRNVSRRIVVDGIVDGLNNAFFKEYFRYFHCGNAEFFAQFFERDNVFGYDRVFDLYPLIGFFLLGLFCAEFSVTGLVLVEIVYRHLTFHRRLFVDGALVVEYSAVLLFLETALGRVLGNESHFLRFYARFRPFVKTDARNGIRSLSGPHTGSGARAVLRTSALRPCPLRTGSVGGDIFFLTRRSVIGGNDDRRSLLFRLLRFCSGIRSIRSGCGARVADSGRLRRCRCFRSIDRAFSGVGLRHGGVVDFFRHRFICFQTSGFCFGGLFFSLLQSSFFGLFSRLFFFTKFFDERLFFGKLFGSLVHFLTGLSYLF